MTAFLRAPPSTPQVTCRHRALKGLYRSEGEILGKIMVQTLGPPKMPLGTPSMPQNTPTGSGTIFLTRKTILNLFSVNFGTPTPGDGDDESVLAHLCEALHHFVQRHFLGGC